MRKREAIKDGFAFASGRIDAINWANVNSAFRDQPTGSGSATSSRPSGSSGSRWPCGSLLFVFLGAPVGILFARRDFLSAFMTCFLPIIGFYYPLMLVGTNLSKEGLAPALLLALDRQLPAGHPGRARLAVGDPALRARITAGHRRRCAAGRLHEPSGGTAAMRDRGDDRANPRSASGTGRFSRPT